jgi:hypothetical protein
MSADAKPAGRVAKSGQSRVDATRRHNFHQQDGNDPLAQPEPAYELDQRVAW